MDGTELLQGALVGGGQTDIGQGRVSLSSATTTGSHRAIMTGDRGAVGWVGLERCL